MWCGRREVETDKGGRKAGRESLSGSVSLEAGRTAQERRQRKKARRGNA